MRNAIACGLALGAVVLLGQSAAAQLLKKKGLSLETARKMVMAAGQRPSGISGAASSRRSTMAARWAPSQT